MGEDILNRFNGFINSFDADACEVCMFVYSLLSERGYKGKYHPTGMYGEEYKLED